MTHQYGTPELAHVPVFRDRVRDLLLPALQSSAAVCVDATVGAGGHSQALLAAVDGLRVVGIDRDTDALALTGDRLAQYGDRFTGVHAVYDEIPAVLAELGIESVDAVLFDLGVSSMQLDVAGRGFAYARDAPLDMRMDQSSGITAADIVNDYDPADLTRVLREFGEERFASRIARAIAARRAKARITSSSELAELVRDAVPAATRRHGGHPAKRTFQALRIEVNAELDVLRRALPAAMDVLRPGGRIAVLSYQSLEDRIVKREFATRSTSSAPVGLPIDVPGTEPTFRLLTRGAQPPSEAEIDANPRAASAKLRAAEKLTDRTGHSRGEDES